MIFTLIIYILAVFMLILVSLPIPSIAVTLEELENAYLAASPAVRAAEKYHESVQDSREEIKSRYGWKFRTSYTNRPIVGVPEETFGDIEHRGSFALSLPLLDRFWKRAYEVKAAESEIEEARWRLEQARNNAILGIRRLYIGTLRFREKANKLALVMDELNEILRIKKTLYDQKRLLLMDVMETEKALIKIKSDFLYNQKSYRKNIEKISAILNIPPKEIFLEDITILLQIPEEGQLMEAAYDNRPELKIAESRANRSRLKATEAKFHYTSLNLGFGYEIGLDRDGDFSSGPRAQIAFSIPLNYSELTKKRRSVFLKEELMWESEKMKMKQDINAQVSKVLNAYIYALGKKEVAEKEVALREENLRVLRTRRLIPTISISISKAEVLQAKADYQLSLMNKKVAEYNVWDAYFKMLNAANMRILPTGSDSY